MTLSSPPADLTPQNVRAARALLAWSQQELAKRANIATSTLADFERGRRTPVASSTQAIRSALESAGIQIRPDGAVIGPPLPHFAPTGRPGTPVRWVDAEDLSQWANRWNAAAELPTILAHLIRATHGAAIHLEFPSDEAVRHSGWDGRTNTEQGSNYVPKGKAGWELSCREGGIAQKATRDYEKRTADPAPLDPAVSTYIFVTPRHWSNKDKWSAARQAEGRWRDVRVYDATDLVHWIELAPAVSQRLATRCGKRPFGTRDLEEMWEEWSRATKEPLTEALVLSDRDEEAAEILRWLRGAPSVLSIQATTAEEAVAFFHATLTTLPKEVADQYRVRCLVATQADAARALAHAPAPLILVLTEPDPGLAQSLAARGHFVLQAYDDRPVAPGDVRPLARPSREGIAAALEEAGISEARAQALARDSARNLAVLRRLMPSAPGRLPTWAQEPPPRALLAALLAGGWDEASDADKPKFADKAKFAELAGEAYDQAAGALARYVGELDCPLRKIGSTWRVASPHDAWMLLARYLTAADIARFEAVAQEVLGAADPRYELDPDKRWMASIHGVRPTYSGLLRHGVGEVLILLALWGDKIKTVSGAERRADAIVRKLLQNADQRRWWSLSRDFRLLAEASPNEFLTAVEASLDQNDPPIRALFGTDEGGVFGTEHLSDLLWALESLAWSPDLMPRVSHLLARLDAIDNPPGKHLNRPANSLREIHLLWLPQTYATLDERLDALDLIREQENDAAWKLMLGVLPKGHDSSSPSAMPRWRDFTVDKLETVTWGLIGRGAAEVSKRLLEDVKLNVPRWAELLDCLDNLAPDGDAALAQLEEAEPKIESEADRATLWKKLREILHHHRAYSDAEWSLPAPVLDRLEAIYERLAPADALERVAWLFDQIPALPNPSHEGWEAERRQVDEVRRQAAQELYAARGVAGILGMARRVSTAGFIGKALLEAGLGDADLDTLLAASLRSDDPRERDVGHGLIVTAFQERKEAWAGRVIARAREQNWGDRALVTILRALPPRRWVWEEAVAAGAGIDEAYWRGAPLFLIDENADEMAYAVQKLISFGRARQALHLAGRDRESRLPSVLLVEALTRAAQQPFENNGNSNEATMFQHDVAELLERLDERPDVPEQTLIALEWTYLSLLKYSQRPAKALLKALSEEPALFIQMLSAVFKPSEDSGVVEPKPADPERAKAIASQAYRLLDLWNRLPGTREDGKIDAAVLKAWIEEARSLASAVGRGEVADSKIGTILSASPVGTDGVWPAEAVREALEHFHNEPLTRGFWIGKRNRRGVTMRGLRDGGGPERTEAATYREHARKLAYRYPHTTRALEALADSYEEDARDHDERAERRDWEP